MLGLINIQCVIRGPGLRQLIASLLKKKKECSTKVNILSFPHLKLILTSSRQAPAPALAGLG